jgi:hypothetical protein
MFAFENRDKKHGKLAEFNRSRRGYHTAQEITTKLQEKHPHITINFVAKMLLTLPKEKTGMWTLHQGTQMRRVYLPSSATLVEAAFVNNPPLSEERRREKEARLKKEAEMRKLETQLRARGVLK